MAKRTWLVVAGTYFANGASIPAGRYRVRYVDG
jgi:hypothetical protein